MPPRVATLTCAFLLAGCAAMSRPATEATTLPGWTAELPELLPAIRACVSDGDGGVRGVTRAWPMARSLAGVRVLHDDGSRVDCIASDAGDKVVLVQPVFASSRFSDEAAPLYTPPEHQPPEGPCIATVPAMVSTQQVGWLSYATCATATPTRQQPPTPSRPGAGTFPPAV